MTDQPTRDRELADLARKLVREWSAKGAFSFQGVLLADAIAAHIRKETRDDD